MKKLLLVLALVATGGVVNPASAGGEMSRSDLMAKGAKALTATELKEALSGSQISGVNAPGFEIAFRLNTDGSVKGTASYSTTEIVGKWFVDAKGWLCTELVSSAGPDSACHQWLKLGPDSYSDYSGTILQRTVNKS